MATITTILATDSGSTSLGVINTNFLNLNTDKIEADSVDTLTNKVFDLDNNTVSNIEVDNFKSSALSGLDTILITGTKGNADELSKWNSDGDLVSTGIKTTTTAPTTSSDDTTVPTSEAVQEALTAQLATTHEMFIAPSPIAITPVALGDFVITPIQSGQFINFVFRVPTGFSAISSMKVVMIPDATESIQYDITSDYGASGEAYNNTSESSLNIQPAVTASQIYEADVSGVFTTIAAGDYCGLKFFSDTTALRIVGLSFKYTI